MHFKLVWVKIAALKQCHQRGQLLAILGWIIYIPLQILFVPISIVGGLVAAYKQVWASKKFGVSSTATKVLEGRLHMHWFGLREDQATDKLSKALPNFSRTAHWVLLFPMYLLYKLSKTRLYPVIVAQGEEGLLNMVPSRTVNFDELISSKKDSAVQFVALGAGFDTRSYGLLKDSNLKLFELDQVSTQQLKIQSLRKTSIDCSAVNFVEADFSKEDWFQRLKNNGYDPSLKTIFLWEGVTLYLSEADVRKTLQTVKSNSAPGSVLIADIYGFDFLKMLNKGSKVLEATNESLGGFGLDFTTDPELALSHFAESEQTALGQHFFLGTNSKNGTFMAVTEIVL